MRDTDVRSHTARQAPADSHPTAPLELVEMLCAALATEGVSYCHWKSNEALARSMSGENDLDLLVAREHEHTFRHVLAQLGFREAALPAAREVPGVVHHYGLDRASGRLVHVHAHYRLVLGDDTTKNFRLPVEGAYIASSVPHGNLPVPAPRFELAVLVLRLVLKHSTWDAVLQRRGTLTAGEQRELDWLLARTSWSEAEAVVAEHLPFLRDAWPACRDAVGQGCSVRARVLAAHRLVTALAGCARRPRPADTALRVVRRPLWAVRHRILPHRPVRKRLVTGGVVVAVVGGDGSGKTTAVAGLASWLSGAFVVRQVHIGRPPRSLTSVTVKSALAAAHRVGLFRELAVPTAVPADTSTPPSTAWLVWHVLTARDRHRLYTRARRVAANGGIVVCDRFPLDRLRTMDAPRTSWARDLPGLSRPAAVLIDREARYYAAFTRPDLLTVLRVHPEVAVRRKTDEAADHVRPRSTEVWEASWDDTTEIIDAGQPADLVLADLKAAVWARL